MDQENNTCVYRHRKLSNGEVFYIGIGSFKRAYDEIRRSTWWKRTVEKHGYFVEILRDNLSWEDACELEIFLIKIYGRKDLGLGSLVNLTDGGEGTLGVIMTKEARDKISIARMGIEFTQEHKDKLAVIKKTPKAIVIAKENLLKCYTEEAIRKAKITQSSAKFKEKLRITRGKKVIDIESGIVYSSLIEVCETFNLIYKKMQKCLSGNQKNKTSFRYYECTEV